MVGLDSLSPRNHVPTDRFRRRWAVARPSPETPDSGYVTAGNCCPPPAGNISRVDERLSGDWLPRALLGRGRHTACEGLIRILQLFKHTVRPEQQVRVRRAKLILLELRLRTPEPCGVSSSCSNISCGYKGR